MRPQYSIVAGAAVEPITLTQATEHLRIDSSDDLSYVNGLVSVAREYVDSVAGRTSIATSWKLIAAEWGDLFSDIPERGISYYDPRYGIANIGSSYIIPLARTPLASVTSVKYYAAGASELTTMDAADYRVITAAEPGIIQLISAPPAVADRADAIEIQFTAGTSEAGPIQKHVIKMMVAHLYENRVPLSAINLHDIRFGFSDLLVNLKPGGFF